MAAYIDADYEKLSNDLKTVAEKVKLCREMMDAGLKLEDGLGEVVGFLEACRDRMPDLIDAGTQGQMSEELFAKVLACNDAVQRTLDAERSGETIMVNDGLESLVENLEESKLNDGTTEGDLLDLSGGAMTGKAQEAPMTGKAQEAPTKKKVRSRVISQFTVKEPVNTGDDNTFVSPFHTGGSGENTPHTAQKAEDDFDRFLADINK